jgi:hypothetical protein
MCPVARQGMLACPRGGPVDAARIAAGLHLGPLLRNVSTFDESPLKLRGLFAFWRD